MRTVLTTLSTSFYPNITNVSKVSFNTHTVIILTLYLVLLSQHLVKPLVRRKI